MVGIRLRNESNLASKKDQFLSDYRRAENCRFVILNVIHPLLISGSYFIITIMLTLLVSTNHIIKTESLAFIRLEEHPFVRARCMVCVLPAPVWP